MREAGPGRDRSITTRSCNRPPRVPIHVHILVTLCRFDDKPWVHAVLGPFIPCERRLGNIEILGIQGRDIRAVFLKQGVWQASSLYLVDTPDYRLTLVYI